MRGKRFFLKVHRFTFDVSMGVCHFDPYFVPGCRQELMEKVFLLFFLPPPLLPFPFLGIPTPTLPFPIVSFLVF